MSELWKVDPPYTNYVPTTAEEAVERFVRCRNNGLKPMLYPECLIQCSRGLDEGQIARFEEWIINPGGPISGDLVPTTEISDSNDAIFAKTLIQEKILFLIERFHCGTHGQKLKNKCYLVRKISIENRT